MLQLAGCKTTGLMLTASVLTIGGDTELHELACVSG